MSNTFEDDHFTLENEALDRNSLLIAKYSKIPSYALWRDIDIEQESINTRLKWWEKEDKTSSPDKLNILINNWINYFKSIKTTQSLSEKNVKSEPDQYCSKRMGNELSCDI